MKTTNYVISVSDTKGTEQKIEQYLISGGLMESKDQGSSVIQCQKFPIVFVKMGVQEAVNSIFWGKIAGWIEEISDITETLPKIGGYYKVNEEKRGIVRYVRDGKIMLPIKFWLDNEEPIAKETAFKNGPVIKESYPVWLFSERTLEDDMELTKIVDSFTQISNALYYDSPRYREKYPRR